MNETLIWKTIGEDTIKEAIANMNILSDKLSALELLPTKVTAMGYGVGALLVILVLCVIAMIIMWKSYDKRLKKLEQDTQDLRTDVGRLKIK